ncbi:MAG: hypothetical protein LBJ71_03390 [Holosporaceae bacterium]|nr:hypothetical protein [Holosporaceae bacterium]
MNTYAIAIILLVGIFGGYVSDLNAVGSKPVVDESAAPSGEEYPGMENFVKIVRELNKEGNGAYLVLGDEGWPILDFVTASKVKYTRYMGFMLSKTGLMGVPRFPDKRWAFLDMSADVSNELLEGRAVLRGNVCDKAMWAQLENSLSDTFLYIADDFNVVVGGWGNSALEKNFPASVKERLDGIWNVLKPGGVLVTQLCERKLTFDEARDICDKFDVYMTDDVFLSVYGGYMAQPCHYERGVNPYYHCVRYWIDHVDDDVKLSVLSDEDKAILRGLKEELGEEELVSGGALGESLYKATGSVVDRVGDIIRKMAPTWKVDTLLKGVDKLKKVDAEFLFNYPDNIVKERNLDMNVCFAECGTFWRTHLIFRKKSDLKR